VRAFTAGARGSRLQNPDTLIKYAFDRVERREWASHATGTYLVKILSGLKWMRLKTPDLAGAVKMSWLKKAFLRLRPSRGTRHRKPISNKQMKWLTGELRRRLMRPGAATAISWIAFLGMLRTREAWTLSARQVRWRQLSEGRWAIHLRMSDKTHLPSCA